MTMETNHAYQDRRVPIVNRVQALLARMTLAEKIGQITAAEALVTDIHWVTASADSIPHGISVRQLIVTEQLSRWDTFVAAWLPGIEGDGVAQVLSGEYPFSAKLPYSWPQSTGQIHLPALQASATDCHRGEVRMSP